MANVNVPQMDAFKSITMTSLQRFKDDLAWNQFCRDVCAQYFENNPGYWINRIPYIKIVVCVTERAPFFIIHVPVHGCVAWI